MNRTKRYLRIFGTLLMIAALGWTGWAVVRSYAPPVPKPHLGRDADSPQAWMIGPWGEATAQEHIARIELVQNLAAAGGMLLVGGTLVAISFRQPRGNTAGKPAG